MYPQSEIQVASAAGAHYRLCLMSLCIETTDANCNHHPSATHTCQLCQLASFRLYVKAAGTNRAHRPCVKRSCQSCQLPSFRLPFLLPQLLISDGAILVLASSNVAIQSPMCVCSLCCPSRTVLCNHACLRQASANYSILDFASEANQMTALEESLHIHGVSVAAQVVPHSS